MGEWYQNEGVLLFLRDVFPKGAIPTDSMTLDSAYHLLSRLVLPLTSHAQQPVRTLAADVAVRISMFYYQYNAAESENFVTSFVCQVLRQHDVENSALSGSLSILLSLSKSGQSKFVRSNLSLLTKFSAHDASIIRQNVAELLSAADLEFLVSMLMAGVTWKGEETILMALYTQLDGLLRSKHVDCLDVEFAQIVLHIVDEGYLQSTQFEVSRMAKQVVPLAVQGWVRVVVPANNKSQSLETMSSAAQKANTVHQLLAWFVTVRHVLHGDMTCII